MGFGMLQFHMNAASGIIIEAYRERNFTLRNDVGINFIFKIDIRTVLEFVQVGRGKKCKAVSFQSGA